MAGKRWALPLAALGAALLYRKWQRGSFRRLSESARDFSRMRTITARGAWLYDVVLGAPEEFVFDRIAREALSRLSKGAVLDVGCGPGRLAARMALLAPGVTVTGLDLAPEMVALARRRVASAGLADRVRFEVGDVAAMPFRDGQFDLVVSSFSLHHWDRVPEGLAEIRRVLRPGGRACIYDMPASLLTLLHHGDALSAEEAARQFGGQAEDHVWNLGPVPLLRRLCLERLDPGNDHTEGSPR